MNRYDEIEKYCNSLQYNASIKRGRGIAIAQARYEGYQQGCKDLLEFIRRDKKSLGLSVGEEENEIH